ncbi:MAG: hypothetical protein LQ351_004842 [Letrouitia transgressa]|nr:MAG: hypothetical protein LQ351_004842 [Letrouitia transgressa]
MNDEDHIPAAIAGRLSRPQRVKDTCDMCSASKVKCDKKKPICSRCQRLGYPCFYSPARRLRKRRCTPSVSLCEEESHDTNVVHEERIAAESNASEDTPNAGARIESLAANPFQAGTLPSTFPMALPFENSYDTESNSPETLPITPSSLKCLGGSPMTNHRLDCAVIAMNALQNLYTTNTEDFSPVTSLNGFNVEALDAAIDKASISTNYITTILVCPCSKRSDIGFLVAAVCSSLLDIYGSILHQSIRSTSDATPTLDSGENYSSGTKTPPWAKDSGVAEDTETINRRIESPLYRPRGKIPTTRILGELLKVADLVTQLRDMCNHISEHSSRDLLRVLVASIASTLKLMINKSTNWLVEF